MSRKPKPKKDVVTLEHMEVETVPIDSIKPNDYNPNRQGPREFELLCKSIASDGFTQPIVCIEIPEGERSAHDGKRGIIVDGFHRWKACKHLGKTSIPVVFTNMTEAQRRISTLRHNRARGSEDPGKVAQMLKEMADSGAISWAQEELMLDDVEIRHLVKEVDTTTDDILQEQARSEASARADQENLSPEEEAEIASDLLRQKKDSAKKAEVLRTMEQERIDTDEVYVVRLVYADKEETEIVKKALGRDSTMRQERFLEICRLVKAGTI